MLQHLIEKLDDFDGSDSFLVASKEKIPPLTDCRNGRDSSTCSSDSYLRRLPTSSPSLAKELFQQLLRRIRTASTSSHRNGKATGQAKVLHERVGYDFSGNLGLLVHQKIVEISGDRQLKKRYKLRVPVMG